MKTDNFDDFSPGEYIETYYPENVGQENIGLLEFYAEAYRNVQGHSIEVGGGPTVYQLISAARYVTDVVFTDALSSNITSVKQWVGSADASPWTNYVKEALKFENRIIPTDLEIADRVSLIKRCISKRIQLDLLDKHSVSAFRKRYGLFDVVSSAFCIDSITNSMAVWGTLLDRVISLLNNDGSLLLTSLGGSREGYSVKDKVFPSVCLDKEVLIKSLESRGFPRGKMNIKTVPAEHTNEDSYDSLICIHARL